jgi:fructosamine-3-kinase
MISSSFKEHLAQVLGCPIKKVESVSGGDISKSYCIHTSTDRFFCKVNENENALQMFLAEKAGLESIKEAKTIRTPNVLSCGKHNANSFLMMEFIESKRPTSKDMENLGHQLAAMHLAHIGESFGWQQDNFIGSLPQSNENSSNWSLFYTKERLLPQLEMALEKKLLNSIEIPSVEILLKSCQQFFPEVRPALLHGDLWSGNYLIDSQGIPYLIDPAVYFGHHEVDMAMTHLFGGFSSSFYAAYAEQIPQESLQNERKDMYQLYYLLVHLNLFGRSYYPTVIHLLKTYFR